ncbi:MAG: chemotaxis response regulator protein-glutamate methylesterase [Phycisphaerae bacterium]
MSTSGSQIRVLVVDDSALMRSMIKQMLASDPGVTVIDSAGSGQVALQKIREQRPDVVTLDFEMPGMSGLELLQRIMAECPVPAVMLSAHTTSGARQTLDALEAGAVDYVAKPSGERGGRLPEVAEILLQKIHAAASANLVRVRQMSQPQASPPSRPVRPSVPATACPTGNPATVIAIGISCGGPQTLVQVFPSIPADCPPIVLTQHMPPGFTHSFAERLDRMSAIEVKEAAENDAVVPGRALIAPGDAHLTVVGRPGQLRVRLDRRGPVCGHMPSADVMFRSVVEACGGAAVGVLMTGMGNDGAEALGLIRAAGGHTLAQDQDTCIVFGMPKVAIELGNAEEVLPLDQIVPGMLAAAAATPAGSV